jgi:hypothetical protein
MFLSPACLPACLQDPRLKPATLTAPPFALRRMAPRSGPLHVSLTLHLHEAADEDRRTVAIRYTANLQQQPEPGMGPRDSWHQQHQHQQRHEFVTQVVEYYVGQQQAAVAEDCTEAAVAAAAVESAAEDPAQPESSRQLKKQRVS